MGNILSIVHYCGYVYHLLSIVALVTSLSLSSNHLSVLVFSSTSRLILSFGPPQLPFLGRRSLLSLSFRLGQSSFVSPVVNDSLPVDNGSTFITYQPSLSGILIFSTVLIARATINLHIHRLHILSSTSVPLSDYYRHSIRVTAANILLRAIMSHLYIQRVGNAPHTSAAHHSEVVQISAVNLPLSLLLIKNRKEMI